MHELAKDGFRLRRINGRAVVLAMIITVQPNSRSPGLTDLALCELVASYFRHIDGDLSTASEADKNVIAKPNQTRSSRINPPVICKVLHHIARRAIMRKPSRA